MQGAKHSKRQPFLSVSSIQIDTENAAVQAIKVLNMIKVYGKPIRVNKASQDKKTMDVGSNLFIGNIDPDVDEKVTPPYNRLLRYPSLHFSGTGSWHAPQASVSDAVIASDLRLAALHGALPCSCCWPLRRV